MDCHKGIQYESWFLNISEIHPGHSAVLNGNYFAFYGIHFVAIIILIISLLSGIITIFYILRSSRREAWNFPDRFPLYLAVSNLLWGVVNLFGHVLLLTTKCLPSSSFAQLLSINFCVLLGYQQLMHAGVSAYTFFKVVRQTTFNLGRGEWKLHLCCLGLMGLVVPVFYLLGSFGNSGYWFSADVRTPAGKSLGLLITICATIHALCPLICFISIRKAVEVQRQTIASYKGSHCGTRGCGPHLTAVECLSTFIRISIWLYCPFAIACWVIMIQIVVFNVADPFTAFFIVIACNSGGWSNALGYWYNKKIKERNPQKLTKVLTGSSLNGYV